MKRAFFLFFCSTNALISFGQHSNASKNIASLLASFSQTHPTEKAYLQFDKPYYAAGDTIYFKAYVTAGEGHQLSNISGVLHVDLVNTTGKIDQSIKLQLNAGLTWGDFPLPDSLPNGNYRVRAYTQWMRNFGDNSFFERSIPVISIKAAKVPESAAIKQVSGRKPDIQFFPEGGGLIAGIMAKVGFKAVGPAGLGLDVSGVIFDNDHKQVATFSSAHLGMGYFYFTPVEGKTYSAQVSYSGGSLDEVSLPAVDPNGLSLSVNNDSLPKATVTISANEAYFGQNKGNAYTLLIYSGGLISTVDCKLDSAVTKLDILKRKLSTGVATVTLFSSVGEPLCERLFFVQNYDQLTLNASSDKELYEKRTRTSIKFNALNRKGEAALGHFSASVINENLVPETSDDEDNILSNLLMTSDLKGYIEQPGYYFSDNNAAVRANLDLVMLTHGYRRFEWKQVLDTGKRTFAYLPETGITISGRVDNLSGKPIANGTINLLPAKGVGLLTASTDSRGKFAFTSISFADTAHFVLSAVSSNGKNSTKITWFKEAKEPLVIAPSSQPQMPINDTSLLIYFNNENLEQKEVANYVNGKPIILKQVNIRDKKQDNQYRTQSLAGAGGADQVMHADELEQIEGPLVSSLNGRLRGVTFLGDGMHGVPYLTLSLMSSIGANSAKKMLVIIDGAYVDPSDINFLNAADVETVEVLKYASASMYGVEGAGGVLVITTKQTRQLKAKDIASIGILPITVIGFYKARQFYSPKYDTPAALSSKQRDLRSTIYWNPEIKTDKDGNASFEYYNADGAGTYKITIEGIDKDGNIGRQVYRYEVK